LEKLTIGDKAINNYKIGEKKCVVLLHAEDAVSQPGLVVENILNKLWLEFPRTKDAKVMKMNHHNLDFLERCLVQNKPE
jgi:hypothetical protein